MTNFNRRRFIKITAATSTAALIPQSVYSSAASEPVVWSGIVLGAEASIKVYGNKSDTQTAINAALKIIKKHEKQLSIYNPNSSISRLNQHSFLELQRDDGPSISSLVEQSKLINQFTDGLFDPTIQPLFEVYAKAQGYPAQINLEKAKALVGIIKVDTSITNQISFAQKGMALTLNGIAQGFITDQVRQELDLFGYKHALINIGEYSAGDENALIGIADAEGEVFDIATIRNQAIATSSPSGYSFPDGTSHIFHPDGKKHIAKWDTVSVIAKYATHADGYSTALALTRDTKLAQRLVTDQIIQRVILKDINGEVHHIG